MAELTPAELRILLSVNDEGGFTAAGTALGMTQSAVSHAIRGMERKFGSVLFDRARTGATPTPAGERAAAHARRILRLYEVMIAEVRADSAEGAPLSGPLHVAAFRGAALHLLPDALERLTRRHPDLIPQVRVLRDVGPGPAGEVAEGRADLAIVTLGGSTPMPAQVITGVLMEEPYALAHPRGHTAPRSLPLVDWEENCSSYTAAWWSTQDWLPHASITAEDDGTVLALVAQGHGMAVMPQLSLCDAPPSIEILDLGPDRPTRQVGYATTPELARTAAVRALIRELRAGRSPGALTTR